jgi:hypothetical protein
MGGVTFENHSINTCCEIKSAALEENRTFFTPLGFYLRSPYPNSGVRRDSWSNLIAANTYDEYSVGPSFREKKVPDGVLQ